MSVLPEILRVQNYSEILFLTVLILAVAALSKGWKRFGFNASLVILLGLLVKVISSALSLATTPTSTWAVGPVSKALKYWLLMPANRILWGNIAFVLLIALIANYSIAKERVKFYLLPLIAFIAIFVWEVRLVIEPNTTRQLIIGMMLVVLMIVRPQGFLGKTRVEVL